VLNITTEQKENWYKAFDEEKETFYSDRKYIQSGMLQGWNKFCFIGGVVEFSAKLPGDSQTGGLWPALWLLGNLARASYVASSDYVWPYSYNQCDAENRGSQEISACDKVGHYGLAPGRGRGAPEIDILETMQGSSDQDLYVTNIRKPYLSTSLQVAPGIRTNRPNVGKMPQKGQWYTNMEFGNETGAELNPFFYGVTLRHQLESQTYQSDALSANIGLSDTHFQNQHIYRVEWEPPQEDGTGGYVKWYVDGKAVLGVSGESLKVTGAEIPSEPMYLLMNTAVSSNWGFPFEPPNCEDCKTYKCGDPACLCGIPLGYCDNFPANFEIDYIRVYQAVNESRHFLGCSPEHRPTERFIKGHAEKFMVDGEKQPLKPIQHGGAYCQSDSDCGGEDMGSCDPKNKCECTDIATGPACLAQMSFYVHEAKAIPPKFQLSSIFIPNGLLFGILSLVLAFSYALVNITTARKTPKHARATHQNYGSMSSDQEQPDTYTIFDEKLLAHAGRS